MPNHHRDDQTSAKQGNNNALTHGGTSQKLLLPGEKQADYDALLNSLLAEYQPELTHHRAAIEHVATCQWFLLRRERSRAAVENALYAEMPDAEFWTRQDYHRLELADRYHTQAERALKRALQNLELIRKNQQSQIDRIERQDRWQAGQDLRERRLELARERFEAQQAAADAAEEEAEEQEDDDEEEEEDPPRRWPQSRIPSPTKLTAWGTLFKQQAEAKQAQARQEEEARQAQARQDQANLDQANELEQTRTQPDEPEFVS